MAKVVKCKACGAEYQRLRPMQKVCSPVCALKTARAQAEKKAKRAATQERKEVKAKLDAMRKKPELVELAQKAFNKFIRARDAAQPCISCGKPASNEPNTWDAGHYRSVGSAVNMRFVESNVHRQCKRCNKQLAGNHVEYRKRLIDRIGLEEVERIESDNTLRKYTHEGLIEIARHYNAEARRLLKGSTNGS